MDPRITPVKLDLKRDERLEIHWQDGKVSTYSISMLRANCPCASCKTVRQEKQEKKPLLQIYRGILRIRYRHFRRSWLAIMR